MYAIIEASGKQFRAEPDSMLRLPRLRAEPGETVTFDVLLTETDGKVQIGQPSLEGSSVAAEVVRHGRGEKIIVFKRKRRKGYRKKQGHRQDFTEVRVTEITIGKAKPRKAKKLEKEEAPVAAEETAVDEAPISEVVEAEVATPEAEVGEEAAAAAEAAGAEAIPQEEAAPEAEATPEINITDAARKLAEEHGLDLAGLEGSGAGGRILKGDVEKAIRAQADEG